MKAVVQNFKTGDLSVDEVPPPALQEGGILVSVRRSVISLGTERSVIAMANKGPLGKAQQRPDLARKVLNKAKQEGYWATYKVVKNLMASPIPLGYSCAGEVTAVGAGVDEFEVGDRVACYGLNFANHAEVNFVPRRLAVPIPGSLSFDEAAFIGIAAIAMQGVRLAQLELGERAVILGLGMIGQIAAQLARAAGASVLALDPDPAQIELARELGAHACVQDAGDLEGAVATFTDGQGADAVIVCAATKSHLLMRSAAEISRLKGRVVIVGDVGLNLERRPFFEKEVSIVISRSTGPGRFDPAYERRGRDYPLPYVRWTQQRNGASFLELCERGQVRLAPLITHHFPIERAEDAYAIVTGAKKERAVAIVLDYPETGEHPSKVTLREAAPRKAKDELRLGVIGAGQFAKAVLLPAFVANRGVRASAFATSSGLTAKSVAERYGASFCTSDPLEVVTSDDTDALLVATRHDQHAALVEAASRAGKPVFVEKPLAILESDLARLAAQAAEHGAPPVMVGFNRRFSPLAVAAREFFASCTDPLTLVYRVNAGALPADHWVFDPVQGGGRILGEVCHFVDLACFVTGSLPERIYAEPIHVPTSPDPHRDSVSVSLRMQSGSVAHVHYLTHGDPSVSKEYFEVYGGGRTAILDNYRTLDLHRQNKKKRKRLMNQAKGHAEEVTAFVRAVKEGGPMPIDFESLVAVSQTGFLILESLEEGRPILWREPSAS